MKLSRYFLLLIAVTIAGVFYVRQQVEATKIGYQINSQQLALTEMLDQRQILLYNVYNLKSPENLQESFYKKSKKPEDFQVLGNKQVIILTNTKQKQIRTAKKRATGIANFLGITSLAEARTQQ